MKFKMLFAPVKTHKTDAIVDAAKAAGATGATIIPARGTGVHEAKTFFGLTLEDQTDIVMFLLEEHIVDQVLEAIRTAGEFDKPGTGIAFVLPVEQVVPAELVLKVFQVLNHLTVVPVEGGAKMDISLDQPVVDHQLACPGRVDRRQRHAPAD